MQGPTATNNTAFPSQTQAPLAGCLVREGGLWILKPLPVDLERQDGSRPGRVSREAGCWGRWPLQNTLASLPFLSEERPQQENFRWNYGIRVFPLVLSDLPRMGAVGRQDVARMRFLEDWQPLLGKCPCLGERGG